MTPPAAMTPREATESTASAAHDTPGNPTRLSYLLLSQARTGSTMLAQMLRARGLGMPFEYLNPELAALLSARWAGNAKLPFERYLALLKQNRTAPNGTFGLKCLATQLERRFRDREAMRAFLVGFDRIVVLRRRDKLAQAVSALRAEQTGQWTSGLAASGAEPAFDPIFVSERIHRFLVQDRSIAAMRLADDRPVLALDYEALRDAPDATWARVQEFLGVEPAPTDASAPSVRPQRDALSAEWERRYLAFIRGEGG